MNCQKYRKVILKLALGKTLERIIRQVVCEPIIKSRSLDASTVSQKSNKLSSFFDIFITLADLGGGAEGG